MSDLISNLDKKNIRITLVDGSDLDVTAPDEIWDNGLEDYLKSHKQELINELIQDRELPTGQEEVRNTEHGNLATTATIATNRTDSAIPLATLGLQVATRHPMGDTDNTANKCSSLQSWIERVEQAQSQIEIFDILTSFRPLDWSDEQRAKMSRAYIHRLEALEALPEVARLMSRHLGFRGG
jgi:hypothetical protein